MRYGVQRCSRRRHSDGALRAAAVPAHHDVEGHEHQQHLGGAHDLVRNSLPLGSRNGMSTWRERKIVMAANTTTMASTRSIQAHSRTGVVGSPAYAGASVVLPAGASIGRHSTR